MMVRGGDQKARSTQSSIPSIVKVLLLLCAYVRVTVDIVEQAHHVGATAIGRIEPRHHVKTKHAHVDILRLNHHVAERLHV